MVKSKSDLLIICGERSGDLHGSIIVKKLLSGNPKLKIHCWGGDLMKKSGAIILEDYRNYSTMGFVEVFSRLNFFFNSRNPSIAFSAPRKPFKLLRFALSKLVL